MQTEADTTVREAASVSPCIAFNSIALFISYFGKFAIPGSPHIFSTVSNLGFIVSAFYLQYKINEPYNGDNGSESLRDSYFICNLSTCASLFLILIGASSLSFHSQSVLFAPAHSFDILFGWLLVVTLVFTASSVSFYAWAGRRLTKQLHVNLFVTFLTGIAALIIGYDTIYNHQLQFYIALACIAIVCAVISRIILVGKRPSLSVIGFALAEIVILVCVAISAVLCQGELLGATLSRESNSEDYDHFHGIWHILLSYVSSIVFVRSLSVARMIELNYPVCICRPSVADIFGELSMFAFSITAVVLKESRLETPTTSVIISGIVSCALYVHVFVSIFV